MAFLLSKLGFWGLIGSVIASGAILVTAISTLLDETSRSDDNIQAVDSVSSEEVQQPEEEVQQPEEEVQQPEEGDIKNIDENNDETSVLRVDSDGNALVAGKVEPNSKVKVVIGDQTLGETTSDESGEYVIIGKVESDEDAQELRIAIKSKETKDTSDVVSSEEELVSSIENEWLLTEDIYVILPVQAKGKELKKYAENAEAEASEKSLPVIIKSNLDEIKIVQNNNASSVDKITIDLISYNEDGEVELAGRAKSSSLINIYLNNKFRYSTKAGIGGAWDVVLIDLAPAVYTLRLDEVNTKENRVTSRLLTPFKKIQPSAMENITERSITVMPGNSLWRIARQVYGKGIQYVEIFEENKSLIKDPDLIYPGQIFNLPED